MGSGEVKWVRVGSGGAIIGQLLIVALFTYKGKKCNYTQLVLLGQNNISGQLHIVFLGDM